MALSNERNSGYRVVTRDDPKSPAAEAFRTLRTNLQFTGLDKPVHSVLITSAGPGEGKTTVAANLAVAVAQSGRRVIVMGADLRKPTIHSALDVSNRVGVTNVLTGHIRWQEAIQETDTDGLHVLAAGPVPPNPAELLASQRMSDLLSELKEAYDIVIIDAPPVIAVTDAGVLSRVVDGVLMVVSVGITPRDVARVAKEQLQQVGARILGVVVNRLSEEAGYYYYYYHRYYSAVEPEKKQVSWLERVRRRFGGSKQGPRSEVAAGRDD